MDMNELPENEAPEQVQETPALATPEIIAPVAAKTAFSGFTIFLICTNVVLTVLLIAVSVTAFMLANQEPAETLPSTEPPVVTTEPTEPSTEPPTEPTTEPNNEKVMLPHMEELYNQNSDIAAWITIEGTKLDYPVMYTPDDPQKYDRLSFEGFYSLEGVPYINAECSLDPESDNLVIYGHNMRNGNQFKTLHSYADKEFWEEHPEIKFTTLYEERTYEILAVFYDHVYYKDYTGFKFYNFFDAEDEEDYNEAIEYYKENALYDTGVTAEYGDQLITLVTCSYHRDKGRFVVVARLVTDEEPVEEVPAE